MSKSVRRTAIVIWLTLVAQSIRLSGQTPTAASYDAAKTFIPRQLEADFGVFRRILDQSHPSLYRYASKELVDATFDGADRLLQNALTEREFARILAGVTAGIKDGHTSVHPSQVFGTFLAERARLLPLRLRYLHGRPFVVEDPSKIIEPGSEILGINQRPMAWITQTLLTHLSGDGDIQAGRFWELNDRFGYWYHRLVDPADAFELECRNPRTSQLFRKRIPGLTRAERTAAFTRQPSGAGRQNQEPLRLDPARLADAMVLTIETFGIPTQEFAARLADAFLKIRNGQVQDLIIDLRGNAGGENFGPLLYSYLTDREFRYFATVETSTDTLALVQEFSRLDANFLATFQAQLVRIRDTRFRVKMDAEPDLGFRKPQPNIYKNRVWFLANGATFSSAATFCSIAAQRPTRAVYRSRNRRRLLRKHERQPGRRDVARDGCPGAGALTAIRAGRGALCPSQPWRPARLPR